MGVTARPHITARVVRTADAAPRDDAARLRLLVGLLVATPAQRVLHPLAGLAHPGAHLIGAALVAQPRVAGRLAELFLGPTLNAVELVPGLARCSHGCRVSAAQRGETWPHGKLPAPPPS